MFLSIFQHLLPNARAWRLTTEKQLRQFFEGLTGLPDGIRDFLDGVWSDLNPQLTRELDAWEAQFGLTASSLTEQERRDRLDAAWKATGGQDPEYIQATLQEAGFAVYLHEWWEPIIGRSGGSVDGDVTPVARNPLLYLNDGTGAVGIVAGDGVATMMDGQAAAVDGATDSPTGYALVNNIPGDNVVDPVPAEYPYYLYIGGAVFPAHANVAASRRAEFETLCLKICPTQQWLGILVDFV